MAKRRSCLAAACAASSPSSFATAPSTIVLSKPSSRSVNTYTPKTWEEGRGRGGRGGVGGKNLQSHFSYALLSHSSILVQPLLTTGETDHCYDYYYTLEEEGSERRSTRFARKHARTHSGDAFDRGARDLPLPGWTDGSFLAFKVAIFTPFVRQISIFYNRDDKMVLHLL